MGTDAQRAAECERCAAQFDSDSGLTVASWPGSKSLHHRSLPALVHARPRDKFSALPTSSDANLVNSRFDLPALWFLTSALPSTMSRRRTPSLWRSCVVLWSCRSVHCIGTAFSSSVSRRICAAFELCARSPGAPRPRQRSRAGSRFPAVGLPSRRRG